MFGVHALHEDHRFAWVDMQVICSRSDTQHAISQGEEKGGGGAGGGGGDKAVANKMYKEP
jgi:hypothetical protein